MKSKILIISLLFTLTQYQSLWSMESKELKEIIESIIGSEKKTKEKNNSYKKENLDIIAEKQKPVKEKSESEKSKSVSFPSPDEALLKSGIQLFEASLYKNSQQKLEELKLKFPESQYKDIASIWLSKIHVELNNYNEAINVLNSINKESGEYPSALFNIAEINLKKGDESGAIEYYYRVASLSPDHELADDSLISIAKLYLKNSKGNQALEAAIRVIKYYEKRETIDDAYFIMAQVFEKDPLLKDIGIARKIYKIFIKKANVDNAQYFFNSPLLSRAKANLKNIESTYYSKAFID